MPRGVRNPIDFDAELADIANRIQKHKAEITKLVERKKQVEDAKKNSEIERLRNFLHKQNLNVDDIIASYTKKESA